MGSLRIWVSYAVADESPQEATLTQQLIRDLRKAGANVVTGATLPRERFQAVLQQELSKCQWFLLVQTRQAIRSEYVQLAMNMALLQANRGQLRGMRRIVCPSSDAWDEPAQWSEVMSYSYQGDYPRLRDKVLLDFGLLGLDGDIAGSNVAEKDVANIATKWLVLDQRAQVAQEYPMGPISQGYPTNDPISQAYPIKSLSPQRYLAQGNGKSVPWQRKEKRRKLLVGFSLSPLFARLQAGIQVLIGRQQEVVSDRPVAIRRPFLFSRRFWLYVTVVVLIFLVFLLVPIQLSSSKMSSHSGTGKKSVALPPAPVNNVLALDTFQRANQTLWGMTSDGQPWGGDANTSPAFSIANGTGQIADTAGAFSALAGPVITDADAEATVMVNQFATGNNAVNTVNIGVVLRWQDTNNWYKALIDGNNFSIDRFVNGNGAIVDTMAFAAQEGTAYTIRFETMGATLQAKVWPSNEAEPPNWMLIMTDTTFTQGQAGVRVVMQNTTQINVLSFKETAL
ncbi:MAG TPA: hypothetical protein VH593_12930 [Ktedonobacteraceae bacterium]|jgi:hypothetical protein